MSFNGDMANPLTGQFCLVESRQATFDRINAMTEVAPPAPGMKIDRTPHPFWKTSTFGTETPPAVGLFEQEPLSSLRTKIARTWDMFRID